MSPGKCFMFLCVVGDVGVSLLIFLNASIQENVALLHWPEVMPRKQHA